MHGYATTVAKNFIIISVISIKHDRTEKNRGLQVPPVVLNKVLENFPIMLMVNNSIFFEMHWNVLPVFNNKIKDTLSNGLVSTNVTIIFKTY